MGRSKVWREDGRCKERERGRERERERERYHIMDDIYLVKGEE